jgi:DNA-binding NarL/FixJ family response regulator
MSLTVRREDSELVLEVVDDGIGFEPGSVVGIARGESPIDPRAARRLLSRAGLPDARAPVEAPGLSPREAQMLRLLVDGLLNKQIAARLGITERTVKAHLTSAYQRVGVADRTQAALWVQRNDPGG